MDPGDLHPIMPIGYISISSIKTRHMIRKAGRNRK